MSNSIKSICLVANPEKAAALRALPLLRSFLKQKKINLVDKSRLNRADAVVTLGGDGTILSIAPDAARLGVPVFGINVGRLGFMTTIGLAQFKRDMASWLRGHWPVVERKMLSVKIPRRQGEVLALNDAVIRIGAMTRVTRVFARIANEDLGTFTGDGVIVATSTGSTAYSLSAQGPVVHPDLNALILTPICAHSFSLRPVVFPAHQVLELQLCDQRNSNEVQLCLDGQRLFPLHSDDVVSVTGARSSLKIFLHPQSSYFGMLREKLQWGERP